MVVTKWFSIQTKGASDIVDITADVQREVQAAGVKAGTATVFVQHTTAAVTIIENEPGLVQDFKTMWEQVIPNGARYKHNVHDDNGHAHLRAALLGPSLVVPFAESKLTLGTWQRIVLIDFDTRPRSRELVVQVMGE